MSDSITLEGREYVSAKRASEMSGYARDYIGQLARKGLIGAQRVGGLWYVSMDSLQGYQKNAESYQPAPPPKQNSDAEAIVSFDGKDYISASRASKISGYNQDYIGQLARAGKILSRQIGNRWYVERAGLLEHKSQKDSLLAAVQREAVGLAPIGAHIAPERPIGAIDEEVTHFAYTQEPERDLMPRLVTDRELFSAAKPTAVPIRVVRNVQPDIRRQSGGIQTLRKPVRAPKKAMIRAAEAGVALTFVIMLSYGLVTLKSSSVYAFNPASVKAAITNAAAAAAASRPLDAAGGFLENLLSKELVYTRAE